MTQDEREEYLDRIQEEVVRFADREIVKLETERDFLQKVLDDSLGGLKKKDKEAQENLALISAKKLLGI